MMIIIKERMINVNEQIQQQDVDVVEREHEHRVEFVVYDNLQK